jgi:enoyl-CoA hydratase
VVRDGLFTTDRPTDGLLVVTLDDGKVNAIAPPVVEGFTEILDDVEGDETIGAMVLVGRPGQFCAGFDLNTIMSGGEQREELVRAGWDMLVRIITTEVPIVTACTGNAVAGGAALLLTGDVRLGTRGDFKIGFNEVAIGIPLLSMLMALAADRLAPSHLFQATTGARVFQPDEAVEAGFLHRVLAPDDIVDAAVEQGGYLASLPREALRMTKQAGFRARSHDFRELAAADIEFLHTISG